MRTQTIRTWVFTAALALLAVPASAQLNGENLLGDMGVKSGSQPHAGLYVGNLYYRYFADTVKSPDGKTVVFDPAGGGSQTIHAAVPLFIFVSEKKLFGGNIGMMAVMPFANGALEAPGLGLSESASAGASDLYVMPLQLGWHKRQFDATAGIAFFAPTGRYASGASDNLGKGMWSYEVSGGGTLYLDRPRSISLSTTAFWEMHTSKEGNELEIQGVTLKDLKVGQLLTLEGGAGKSFLGGAASVGVAYYAQWKVTQDSVTASIPLPEIPAISKRHRVFGVGPDITIPIATKKTLISLINVRYLWETGAQTKTQGQSLMVTTTVPVGGISIHGK